MIPTLQRTIFETSRLLDFASEKELTAQTGHDPEDWPLVVLKELVDNALDGCEEAGIAPEVSIVVDDQGITIGDNCPGIPAEAVRGILDFSIRVSSRGAYVSPTRGAQGNALRQRRDWQRIVKKPRPKNGIQQAERPPRHAPILTK